MSYRFLNVQLIRHCWPISQHTQLATDGKINYATRFTGGRKPSRTRRKIARTRTKTKKPSGAERQTGDTGHGTTQSISVGTDGGPDPRFQIPLFHPPVTSRLAHWAKSNQTSGRDANRKLHSQTGHKWIGMMMMSMTVGPWHNTMMIEIGTFVSCVRSICQICMEIYTSMYASYSW